MKKEYMTPRIVVCPLETGSIIADTTQQTIGMPGGDNGRNDGDFEDLSIGGNSGLWDTAPDSDADGW